MGYVYVITDGKLSKIGRTKSSPEARLKALQTGHPLRLRVACSFECVSEELVEKALHDHFADRRLEGEWFDVVPEEVAAILADSGLTEAFRPRKLDEQAALRNAVLSASSRLGKTSPGIFRAGRKAYAPMREHRRGAEYRLRDSLSCLSPDRLNRPTLGKRYGRSGSERRSVLHNLCHGLGALFEAYRAHPGELPEDVASDARHMLELFDLIEPEARYHVGQWSSAERELEALDRDAEAAKALAASR